MKLDNMAQSLDTFCKRFQFALFSRISKLNVFSKLFGSERFCIFIHNRFSLRNSYVGMVDIFLEFPWNSYFENFC